MKRLACKVRLNTGVGTARSVGNGFAIAVLMLVLGGAIGVSEAIGQTGTIRVTGDTGHHALLTALLGEHVHYGRVDYAALQNDPRLDSYLAQLVATDPDTIANRDDRLALWLNAYNAYTLKVIVDNYPIDSINDLHTGGLVIGHVLHKTVQDGLGPEIRGGRRPDHVAQRCRTQHRAQAVRRCAYSFRAGLRRP